MTVYELNKGIYTNVSPMKEWAAKKIIFEFFNGGKKAEYYMMLNHDIHYFTLFHITEADPTQALCDEVYSIAAELGDIVDVINNQDTQMLELWIRYDNEPIMFGLFDYDRGVVEV